MVGKNFLYSLPVLGSLMAFMLLGFAVDFARFPGMLATFLSFPLLIRESDKVRRDAEAIWLSRANTPEPPAA